MPPAKPIPHCYWVEEGRFLAGEYPRDWQESSSRQKLQAILDAGTTAFVDFRVMSPPLPTSTIIWSSL